MKILQLFLFSLFLLHLSCTKKQDAVPTTDNCQAILEAKVLTPDERANACFYLDVFSYRNKLYTICECCVCDKAYTITDCDGANLFEISPESVQDFWINSTYVFSVAGN